MKKLYFYLVVVFIYVSRSLNAQCSGGSNGGALNPAPSSAYQTMNCPAGDFYYTFVVAASSCYPQYDFSFCAADGSNATFDTQITILNNSGTAVAGGYSDDYCSTQSHVFWTPTMSGTYRVHVNRYNCVATTTAATLAYRFVASYTNTAEYTVNDDAVSTGSCTTLTSNSTNQRGCVWDVNSTLNFASNFSYDFTVNLGSSDAGADGMAFVIQNDAKGRCACGTSGGSLGAGGITNSLIVEIDTYLNFEDRDDFSTNYIGCSGTEDPDHLDLWFNGTVNPDLDANCGATAAGERPVTSSAVRLQNPPGTNYNIENGANHVLRASWTAGSPGTFTARILNTALTTTYATISTTLNPMTVFGTNTPYFGFTGSTGGLTNQQTICNALTLLPIELTSFVAVCNNNSIDVNWTTATETNSKSFDLERSVDGIMYTKIASIPASGNSSHMQHYYYQDKAQENTTYYYRLKHYDIDGFSKYQKIIASSENSCYDINQKINVYPNPASNNLYIKSEHQEILKIELLNDCGQIVISTVEKPDEQNMILIETNHLADGIYVIRIFDKENITTQKILIQH